MKKKEYNFGMQQNQLNEPPTYQYQPLPTFNASLNTYTANHQ